MLRTALLSLPIILLMYADAYAGPYENYRNWADCWFGESGHKAGAQKTLAISSACHAEFIEEKFETKDFKITVSIQDEDNEHQTLWLNWDYRVHPGCLFSKSGDDICEGLLEIPRGTLPELIEDFAEQGYWITIWGEPYLPMDDFVQHSPGHFVRQPDFESRKFPVAGLSGIMAPRNPDDCIKKYLKGASDSGSKSVSSMCIRAFRE